MSGHELLRSVFVWLPAMFALDLVLFHLAADHPLATRWWWGRQRTSGAVAELVRERARG